VGGASRLVRLWALGCLVLMASWPVAARAAVSFQVTLRDTGIADQDDMCIWLHPSDLSRSTVICSDKTAYKLFVYDLNGNTIQVVAAEHRGNIDVRYQFPLGGRLVDIVALNERGTSKIRVYKVIRRPDSSSRSTTAGSIPVPTTASPSSGAPGRASSTASPDPRAPRWSKSGSWSTTERVESRGWGRCGSSSPAAPWKEWWRTTRPA